KAGRPIKKRCRTLFPTIARGGFDVYICFIKAGLDILPPGGRLGYIIPNKFLIAEYARALREELLTTVTIDEIIDVSDIPTFRDAAVYPVMMVLRKTPPLPDHQVSIGHVSDLAQLETDSFPRVKVAQARWQQSEHSIFWLPPVDSLAANLVDRLLADQQAVPLGQLLDIRWSISFHRAGIRDVFVFPEATGNHPRRLLGGKRFHGNADVRRYRLDWSGWWIDYDEEHAKALHNQFPPLSLFTQPKIVIAQNARRIIATLDRDGYACKDTFLVGCPCSTVPLEYVLGILNSSLLSYLYSILFKATHVGGAYLHYLACYLNELPIRVADDPRPICALVERMLDPTLTAEERQKLDHDLDQCVNELYGLSDCEQTLVNAAIPYAWGEAGARRGSWDARKCAIIAQS
ncbi:MAG TPA: TaqI-like C-terminal specificity domain-containing protein, partial [Armatimonadota bacterium]|nr:TaqI-like C-terminal specificity domain-containing protein [Armatimonadota bacterium]